MLKSITRITIMLLIALLVFFSFSKAPYFMNKIIGVFYPDEICIHSHCLKIPDGWNNEANGVKFMSSLTGEELPENIDKIFMLRNINNEVVSLRYVEQDFDRLPKHIVIEKLENCFRYAYEKHKIEQQDMLLLGIEEYNIEVILSNNEKIKNTMLTAICNKD